MMLYAGTLMPPVSLIVPSDKGSLACNTALLMFKHKLYSSVRSSPADLLMLGTAWY